VTAFKSTVILLNASATILLCYFIVQLAFCHDLIDNGLHSCNYLLKLTLKTLFISPAYFFLKRYKFSKSVFIRAAPLAKKTASLIGKETFNYRAKTLRR